MTRGRRAIILVPVRSTGRSADRLSVNRHSMTSASDLVATSSLTPPAESAQASESFATGPAGRISPRWPLRGSIGVPLFLVLLTAMALPLVIAGPVGLRIFALA